MSAKRTVVFFRRLAKPNMVLGAAYMRGDQLVEMIRPHLANTYALRVLPFHAGLMPGAMMHAIAHTIPRDSIVIFIKSASRGLTQRHLEILAKRGAVIGLDSVDTPVGDISFEHFDFHIAASISGQKALRERLGCLDKQNVPVELLLHHADPRLRSNLKIVHNQFKCGYVGRPENLFIPDGLSLDLSVLSAGYPYEFMRILDEIRSLSLHYAIRPEHQNSDCRLRAFKPFTKGMVAAACSANILVQRETDDAVELLGEDYPYLVSRTSRDSIRDAFQRARDDFGGKRWQEGLERMRSLDAAVSNLTLANRMREILDHVSDLRRIN